MNKEEQRRMKNNKVRNDRHQHYSTDTDLPGKVHMRVLFLVPTTGLESAARGVCFNPATGRNSRRKGETE